MLDFYEGWNQIDSDRLKDEKWQQNNLEWDLRTCDWVLAKVRASDIYAQNLYAALCNNDFAKTTNIFKLLKEEYWSCSWRSAGGIISNMRGKGDYIDWYCSGIGGGLSYEWERDGPEGYVSEGAVTEEIKQDLEQIGWIVIAGNN
jgi:hypothetical protein